MKYTQVFKTFQKTHRISQNLTGKILIEGGVYTLNLISCEICEVFLTHSSQEIGSYIKVNTSSKQVILKKGDKMSKWNIFMNICEVAVIIVMLILVLRANGISSDAYEKINDIQSNVNQMAVLIEGVDNDVFRHQTELDIHEVQMADLWFALLDEEEYIRIQDWEKESDKFISCEKGIPRILIHRNYFEDEGYPAKSLIYSFDKGDLIYQRDGEVRCYLDPIRSLNPPKVNCELLCLDNGEEK